MIPIFKPFMPQGIISEIETILYSGNLSFGRYGKEFEVTLRRFIENPLTMSASTYNQALLIALSSLCLEPGDEIIASPVSCLASNQPFAIKNAKIIWADIYPLTGGLDPDDVKRRITPKTKAIFHNHYCGYLDNINEIIEIAKENNLFVVHDAIESFGSIFEDKYVGNINADITVFSFQTVRLPNTIDGGALSFKNDSLFQKALKIRDYGIDRVSFRDSRGEINPETDIELEGYGALLSEVNSFIGVKQMEHIDGLLAKQKKNAQQWDSVISKMNGVIPLNISQTVEPNYWIYGVLCEDKKTALDSFRKKGYYATGVHINNNIYSIFKNSESLKGVNEFMSKFIALPCGWWINSKDINL